MFVSPQHLQQLDLYHERLLEERLAALSPYPWGVSALEIDLGALATHQLKLTRFLGVLPDGLLISFEDGDPESPPARPIEASFFPPTRQILEIYLGAAREREGVPSVSAEESAPRSAAPRDKSANGTPPRTRYRMASRSVGDLTGEGAELAMAFAQRNLALFLGDEPRDDFDTIKIAEVVRGGSGTLVLNETFIPPLLRIDASPFMMEGAGRLLALMTTRQRQLAEERRHRDGATVEFNANDITRYLQLHSLNGVIPVLTHLGRVGDMSPRDLYLILIQAAGQLATFSPTADPSTFPAFNYTDLRATFEELFAIVTSLVQSTIRQLHVPVPLELTQGIYLGRMEDERIRRCQQFVLAVRAPVPEDQWGKLPHLCKIASRNQLPSIVSASTNGIPLKLTPRPPTEIPVRPGVAYFLLTESDHWKSVLDEKAIAIYLPPSSYNPSQVKLELFGIPKRA
jgi:type VI secretion system protein ImpJ